MALMSFSSSFHFHGSLWKIYIEFQVKAYMSKGKLPSRRAEIKPTSSVLVFDLRQRRTWRRSSLHGPCLPQCPLPARAARLSRQLSAPRPGLSTASLETPQIKETWRKLTFPHASMLILEYRSFRWKILLQMQGTKLWQLRSCWREAEADVSSPL